MVTTAQRVLGEAELAWGNFFEEVPVYLRSERGIRSGQAQGRIYSRAYLRLLDGFDSEPVTSKSSATFLVCSVAHCFSIYRPSVD